MLQNIGDTFWLTQSMNDYTKSSVLAENFNLAYNTAMVFSNSGNFNIADTLGDFATKVSASA